jgi:short-subunit dehydrogenase
MSGPDGGLRRTALITGASAGIGAALARVFAANGWNLILTARRVQPLEGLARELTADHGVDVAVLPADLAEPDAAATLASEIRRMGLSVDGLVNNAGFSLTTGFVATDPADHAAMIRVMLTGPVELSRLLLPGMIERGFGRILNVASLAGLMPATGGDTLYGPIKAFMIKASAGLHLETAGTGVHVTALCPGYTWTEFHDVNGSRDEVSSAYPRWMWQTADHVARVGYRAVQDNRVRVVPGWRNTLLAAIPKLLPDALALKIIGGHAKRLKRI